PGAAGVPCRGHCRNSGASPSTPDPARKQAAFRSPAPTKTQRQAPTSLRHYPHSAPPPAASFNPASMRSHSRPVLPSPFHATSQNPQDSQMEASQIQHGGPRRLVMSAPTPLRQDFDAPQVRGLARKTKDGPQARRLLALAAIYDGATRTEAAKIGGVGLQIIRDWVLRFNARGPDGLLDGKSTGQPSKLNDT